MATKWSDNWDIAEWEDTTNTLLLQPALTSIREASLERTSYFFDLHESEYGDTDDIGLGFYLEDYTFPDFNNKVLNWSMVDTSGRLNYRNRITNAVYPDYAEDMRAINEDSIKTTGTATVNGDVPYYESLAPFLTDTLLYPSDELLHLSTNIPLSTWTKQWFECLSVPRYHRARISQSNDYINHFSEAESKSIYIAVTVISVEDPLSYLYVYDNFNEVEIINDEYIGGGSAPFNLNQTDVQTYILGLVADYLADDTLFIDCLGTSDFNQLNCGYATYSEFTKASVWDGATYVEATGFVQSFTLNQLRYKIKQHKRPADTELFTPIGYKHYFIRDIITDPPTTYGTDDKTIYFDLSVADVNGWHFYDCADITFDSYPLAEETAFIDVPDGDSITTYSVYHRCQRNLDPNQVLNTSEDFSIVGEIGILLKPNDENGDGFEYYTP